MFLVSKGANSGFCRRYPIVIVRLTRDAPGRALGSALPPRRCVHGPVPRAIGQDRSSVRSKKMSRPSLPTAGFLNVLLGAATSDASGDDGDATHRSSTAR